MLGFNHSDAPIDPKLHLYVDQRKVLEDPRRYRHLVGKFEYLTVIRSYISVATSVVSRFMEKPCSGHMEVVICILQYLKRTPSKDISYKK